MSYPVLTYVKTGEYELTEITKTGKRVIDISRAIKEMDRYKRDNQLMAAKEDYAKVDTDIMDEALSYFESLEIGEIPATPKFEHFKVGVCGVLAQLVRGDVTEGQIGVVSASIKKRQ